MYTLLVVFFLVAILVSFICSLWEAVLLSVTPSYAQIKLREGTRTGRLLQQFKENIDRPLAAILTLNTIAHTVGALGVGDQSARIWGDTHPAITQFAIPVAMTMAILVLSEIIPKTVGAVFWKELAPFTVASLTLLTRLLAPLVWLSQMITRSIRRDGGGSVLSRSDFLVMAEIGAQEGVLHHTESKMLNSLLRFNTVRAEDVMTPRTVVEAMPEEVTIREAYESQRKWRFSRLPTYRHGSKDQITGYVLKDELLARLVEGGDAETVRTLRREIMVIAEDFRIPDLFNRFVDKREHIALVIDGFGGMAGIVTMEDVIETLLGMEIVDEMDSAKDMQRLARRAWERRARLLGIIEEVPDAGAVAPDEATAPATVDGRRDRDG